VADEKKYKCKYCKEKFLLSELRLKMPQVCNSCIGLYFEENKEKIAKKVKDKVKQDKAKEKQKKKEALMTKSDYLKIAQKYFNQFIRLRDKGKPCISCGQIRKANDAGHLFTVGSHPELRYDEDNCHLQCVACNQHQHGNIANYMINLPNRIGKERFDALLERRNKSKNYTIDDIKEIIELYKNKIKELKT